MAIAKISIEIVVRKYSAKSLRGSDVEIRGMVHSGYISLAFGKKFPSLLKSKYCRSHWIGSETSLKSAPNE